MKIMSNLLVTPIKDLRKTANLESPIVIKNKDLFIKNMQEQGFNEEFEDVLIKHIDNEEVDEIDIILSISDTFNISNIIYYKDNENVEMDENFTNKIISIINEANQ